MTAKNWLSQGKNIEKEIKALKEALSAAKSIPEFQRSNYEHELESKINELILTKSSILSAIYCIEDNVLRTLLIERFLNNKTWETVAHRLGYDFYHVIKRLYPKAVNEVEKSEIFKNQSTGESFNQ